MTTQNSALAEGFKTLFEILALSDSFTVFPLFPHFWQHSIKGKTNCRFVFLLIAVHSHGKSWLMSQASEPDFFVLLNESHCQHLLSFQDFSFH